MFLSIQFSLWFSTPQSTYTTSIYLYCLFGMYRVFGKYRPMISLGNFSEVKVFYKKRGDPKKVFLFLPIGQYLPNILYQIISLSIYLAIYQCWSLSSIHLSIYLLCLQTLCGIICVYVVLSSNSNLSSSKFRHHLLIYLSVSICF